jgi:hypothetical protein
VWEKTDDPFSCTFMTVSCDWVMCLARSSHWSYLKRLLLTSSPSYPAASGCCCSDSYPAASGCFRSPLQAVSDHRPVEWGNSILTHPVKALAHHILCLHVRTTRPWRARRRLLAYFPFALSSPSHPDHPSVEIWMSWWVSWRPFQLKTSVCVSGWLRCVI